MAMLVQGYALIEYETFKEAERAVKEANGVELLGQAISVAWAFARPPEAAARCAPAVPHARVGAVL